MATPTFHGKQTRPTTARQSALGRAFVNARHESQSPATEYLPTCALATFHSSPQGRMLLWALEAGADLLPPAQAMELRSAVLEKPTSTEAINSLGAACEKNAHNLQLIYVSHICASCDEGTSAKSSYIEKSPARRRGTKQEDGEPEDLDPSAPRFLLMNAGMSAPQVYNQLQRRREKEIRRDQHRRSKHSNGSPGNISSSPRVNRDTGTNGQTFNDDEDMADRETPNEDDDDQFEAEEGAEKQSVEEHPENVSAIVEEEDEFESEISEDGARVSTPTLRQHRERLQAAELALVKINKYVEQGPSYLLPLYRHQSAQGQPHTTNSKSRRRSSAATPQTRSSQLRTAIAFASVNGAILGSSFLFSSAALQQSTTIGVSPASLASPLQTATQRMEELSGTYQMPSYGSLQTSKSQALAFRKSHQIVKLLNKMEGMSFREQSRASRLRKPESLNSEEENAEQDEMVGDEDEEDGGGGGDNDGPLLDVRFLPETGTLSVKFRLSEAQLIDARSKISVPKVINADGKEEEGELAISTSTYLFQTEFIAIAADLWMGARGPWKGRMLHIARRAARPDGTSALVEPPYLGPLGRLLDERSGTIRTNASGATSSAQNTTIDSIVVGQWCFTKVVGRTGGRPDDPYRCTGCGNTRTSANIAYATPSTANGMKRGKYYCPFCRRSMTHVNVALSMDPAAATRAPQWNGGPKIFGR